MNWITLLTLGHILGAAFGIGGAAVSDALFFRMIRKEKIERENFEIIKLVSKIVITGLSILIVTGAAMLAVYYFVFDTLALFERVWFQAKLTIVLVLIINGVVFHLKVLPIFKKNLGEPINSPDITSKIFLLALTGAISVTSWYSVLILAVLKNMIDIPYLAVMGIYVFLIVGGVLTSYPILTLVIYGWQDGKKRLLGLIKR